MSTDAHRIPTTHTGSLPRPDDLVDLMWARGDGLAVDEDALARRSAEQVAADPERRKRTAPACNGEVAVKDRDAIAVDMANLAKAAARHAMQGIDPDVAWAKPRALSAGAAIASERLWP